MNRLVASFLFAGATCFAAPNPPPGGANGMPPPGRKPQGQSQSQHGGRDKSLPAVNLSSKQRRNPGMSRRVPMNDLSDADQRLVDQIEEADSIDALLRLSRRAASSRSADVRMAMVDALESQGERAANDIAYYIADSDEDVAESAFSAWTGLLGDMSRSRRVQAIRAAAQTLATAGSMQMRGGDQRQGYGPMQGPGQYQGHGPMQGPGAPQGPGAARWGNR